MRSNNILDNKSKKIKLIRVTTVPSSMRILLKGQHHFLENNGFDVLCVSSSGQDLVAVGAEENVRIATLEMTRKITPVADLIAIYRFYKICILEKPHIVHSHTPKAGLIAMIGSWLAGVKIRVHDIAGLPVLEKTGFIRRIVLMSDKITYFFSTHIFCNSFKLRDILISNEWLSKEKVQVLGNGSTNGVDVNFFNKYIFESENFNFRTRIGISHDDFVFIFVGRLVGDKGINELIAAFNTISTQTSSLFREDIGSCVLILVGETEDNLDPIQQETAHLINSNRQIFAMGLQNDVRPFLSIADCLVFPSYREGFPNAVLEALSMELPCIVTDINGCNEIVTHGYNGLIIQPKDIENLREAMELMWSNIDLYKKMQSNARQSVVTTFDRGFSQKSLLEAHLRIIETTSD